MNPDSQKALALSVSRHIGVPVASRKNKILKAQPGQGLDALVPKCFAVRHGVLPLFIDGDVLAVAMIRPDDTATVKALRLITRYEIQPFVATRSELRQAIAAFY